MNKITWIAVGIMLISSVAALAACTNPAGEFAAPTQNAVGNVEVMDASWVHANSLDDLIWGADLIIEGTIASIKDTRLESTLIYTDYQVDLSKVLKSYPDFADRSVVVSHNGGTYQGKTQIRSEDEPFQVGEKVLLFLKDLSIFPGKTRPGETKYSVIMPGGRFRIEQDGKLDTPTKNLKVADAYRGRDKSFLENDIVVRLPTPSDYLQQAVAGSFLIVEGTVGSLQKTFLGADVTPEQLAEAKAKGELPDQLYTFYAFTVDRVLEDKLARYKDQPRKTALYMSEPVNAGDVITVIEMGGTYEGITQHRTAVPFLKPGDRMLLFLSAIACGDRLPICTPAEQNANKDLYMLGGAGDRFLITSDNRVTALDRLPLSRFYNGQPRSLLEQDIAVAKVKLEKTLEDTKNLPTPAVPSVRPPTAAP